MAGRADGGCNLSTARDGGDWGCMGPQPSAGMWALHGPQEQTARVTAASRPLRAPRSARGLASLLASDLLCLLGNGRDAHAAFRDGPAGLCREQVWSLGRAQSQVWGRGVRLARMTSPLVTALTVKFTFRGVRDGHQN